MVEDMNLGVGTIFFSYVINIVAGAHRKEMLNLLNYALYATGEIW